MKRRMRFYFLFSIIVLISISTFAQKAKYQSNIVFKISKYITWPEKEDEYKFVIGVLGSSTDFESFQLYVSQNRGSHSIPVEIRYFESTEAIDECDLLYVSEECEIEMEQIIKKTRKEPMLIVSGKKGDGKLGAVINFVETDEKVKIELNKNEAEKRGLLVSDKLTKIAIII